MKKFLLYGHGGSYNHGAEAIVKTTIQMIRRKYPLSRIILSSHFPEQDREFGVDADEIISPDTDIWQEEKRAEHESEKWDLARKMYGKAIGKIDKDTICLSVGGDNFCYGNWHRLGVFQEKASAEGAKSILWGCSVEPTYIDDCMVKTLNTYTHIAARESITYNALKGIAVGGNVILAPDPAFALEAERCALPSEFLPGNMIGFNLSPLVVRRESSPGVLMKSAAALIKYIIKTLNYGVALIPHVTMSVDNDYELLSELRSGLSARERERTCLIGDKLSAAEYKYVISQCRSLICARTHASIAAYSSGIPTLVIGYSVKSRGIAHDLGMADYVLPTGDIVGENSITDTFARFHAKEDHISVLMRDAFSSYNEKIQLLLGAL